MADLEGLPTTNGSRAARRPPPSATPRPSRRLIEAGAVPLGQGRDLRMGLRRARAGAWRGRPPRNPWDPAHITGGSSSGSAAAVAAGMVRLAVG